MKSDVYTEYFQKSKVFLYPLLKLKKGIAYVPIQTYVCWEHTYAVEEHQLLCEYKSKSNDKFKLFCNKYLKSHPLFVKYLDLKDDKHLFIFDLKEHKNDFDRFLKGKYSQFSFNTKLTILDFFNSSGHMLDYIHYFLSPDEVHKDYADALNVDVDLIVEIYEVCSIPNLHKETFYKDNEILNCLLTKNSIYLEK
tara:strand:+ start:27 stop:608 length:582 start_codon:yes stop_codon:yes gene_type:complete